MSETIPLIEFETEYPKLYEILVNGNPIYAALRDGVNVAVNGGGAGEGSNMASESGKVSFRRIIDSFVKLNRFKKAKTLIFTSAVYRRDRGRNLAAEFLMDKYPDAVVFEWPARNEGFDFAYFKDSLKNRYCPLEWYLIKYKLYMRLHRKEYDRYCDECRVKLADIFPENSDDIPDNHRRAIEYIKAEMPNSYAVTIISQNIFRKLFSKYGNIEYAVDFWGSARENIIPVLPVKPQSVELQHGIITRIHPGYIYPKFVKELNLDFFKRTLLVYGNKTKEMLTEDSIFDPDRIEVIGNPRMQKYKTELLQNTDKRNLILFASQTYESDGTGKNYYDTVIPLLQHIEKKIIRENSWHNYRLGIKLHPREGTNAIRIYRNALSHSEVFDNASQLYDLLGESFVQLTVSSTTLFEAAELGTPTIMFEYNGITAKTAYGFDVRSIRNNSDADILLDQLLDKEDYNKYLEYIIEKSREHL